MHGQTNIKFKIHL